MGRFIKVELNDEQRAALEKGYRDNPRHAFRLRCQMVLLKSRGRTSTEIAEVVDCCEVAVTNWVKCYTTAGLEGLRTKEGRGRRPLLDHQQDAQQVRAAVRKHRQRISLAKAELEHTLAKDFSLRRLVRFLNSLVADIHESAAGCKASRTRKLTRRRLKLCASWKSYPRGEPEMCSMVMSVKCRWCRAFLPAGNSLTKKWRCPRRAGRL